MSGADLWYAAAPSEKKQGDACAQIGDWRGAYARLGTATEFLIKAIYLRNTQQNEMPASHRTARSHDLGWMATEAGLAQQIAALTGIKRSYWLTVRDWDEGRRYPNAPFPAHDGKSLRQALCNPTNGVWQWLLTCYLTN